MKVGFDLSQSAHPGGVATYTQELARELIKLPELKLTFFYSSLRKPYSGKLANVKLFKLPPTLFEILFNRLRIVPIEKFIGPIDIFHSSDWIQPPTKAKKVTTYHDVIPLKYPEWSDPKIVKVHRERLGIVEKEIDAIITVSENTKKDLVEVSKIPEENIVVIYEGVSEKFKPLTDTQIENFRGKYNLPKKFILSIGGIGERRNLKRVREVTKNYDLIIAGEDINVTDDELPLLYNAATILLYPSLYEGFGLPILEAMACGTPVITSNVSSMPEVGGNACFYVDPQNVKDIKEKVTHLFNDQNLRWNLRKKGFEQAKKFSWEKAALETAEVYRKLIISA